LVPSTIERLYNRRRYLGTKKELGKYKGLVQEFEKEYDEIRRAKKEKNNEEKKGELLGRYIVKMLYEWDNKRFDKEY